MARTHHSRPTRAEAKSAVYYGLRNANERRLINEALELLLRRARRYFTDEEIAAISRIPLQEIKEH